MILVLQRLNFYDQFTNVMGCPKLFIAEIAAYYIHNVNK